eukprot:Pgem_evm1s15552
MAKYIDERDGGGPLIITHTYLLLGCAIPVWSAIFGGLDGSKNSFSRPFSQVLVPYSGIISL